VFGTAVAIGEAGARESAFTMIEIERDDVLAVADWSGEEFGDWLVTETEIALYEPPDSFPYKPLHFLFDPSIPPAETLKAVHDALSARARKAMRQGLALAIQRLSWSERARAVLDEFLRFTAYVDASEAAPSIAYCFGIGPWGARTDERGGQLFANALGVFAELPQNRSVLKALEDLTSSVWFRRQPELAPAALLSLARLAPHQLVRHLDRIGEQFSQIDTSPGRSTGCTRIC
jgi:hypothetical protein